MFIVNFFTRKDKSEGTAAAAAPKTAAGGAGGRRLIDLIPKAIEIILLYFGDIVLNKLCVGQS